MKLGCDYPTGPLALADFVDGDAIYAIGDSLYEVLKRIEYASPALKRMIASGRIGPEARQDFYAYPAHPAASPSIRLSVSRWRFRGL